MEIKGVDNFNIYEESEFINIQNELKKKISLGNGYLHQRHMGTATHASFFLNKPTIGVAKSYLKIKETDFEMPEDEEGSYTDIVINKEIYGRVLRTRKTVKPIFISCGNYIDLDSSTEIVLNLINNESRLPIPTRLSDLETHIKRRELR
ncbi:hypothetical protein A0J52_06965 [Clostridium sporogenes]|nr:hypothetical protein A0J52_06965 [Clostridium sporogenes]